MNAYQRLVLAHKHPELQARVDAAVGCPTDVFLTFGERMDNLLNPDVIEKIKMAIPHCVRMNNIIFLVGGKRIVSDVYDHETFDLYEFFDISTEILTGDSYSHYSQLNHYFLPASVEETLKVIRFLEGTNGKWKTKGSKR